MMAVRKFAPSIVVLKPGVTTPVWTLMLAEMAARFLPDGGFKHSGHAARTSRRVAWKTTIVSSAP